MANISSVGIGSGVLTSDLIDKLVAAEKEPTELRLNAKEEAITTELSVFGQIQSSVTDFRLASRSLADPKLFQTLNLSSSNSAVSGQASEDAQTGSFTLEVSRLATSQSLSTNVFADSDTTEVGTGTLTIAIGSASTDIVLDSNNNSLDGIAAAINNQSDVGVSASVINVGSGYRLVLTSDETGLENSMEITVSGDGDGDDTDALGLSQLVYSGLNLNINQNQEASDALFELNGLEISRSTNSFDDVITGVSLTLSGTNEGSPAVIEISRDNDLIAEKVSEFVDKFNAVEQIISDNTVFNPDNPAASGLLLGDTSTRNIINQIRSVISQSIAGLESATVRSAAELGIETNKDTGQLTFDKSELISRLKSDPSAVAGVFADQGRTTDSQVQFARAGVNTKVGTYDVEVTQLATRGDYTGSVSLGASTLIDADNDDLSVLIDGTSSGPLTLEAGSYTPAELAAHIQEQINSSSSLQAAGKSVIVTVDGSDQIQISSAEYGSTSSVELTNVDTNTLAQLGLDVGAGVAGLNVEGLIDGVLGTGSGQYLTGAEGNDAESLRVLISGGVIGDRGTVSYIEGVGEQMVDLINNFLGSNGTITAKNERLNAQLEQISNDRLALAGRIESLNARLVRQFTAADIAVSRLNSTQDFVKAQLDALLSSTTQKK